MHAGQDKQEISLYERLEYAARVKLLYVKYDTQLRAAT